MVLLSCSKGGEVVPAGKTAGTGTAEEQYRKELDEIKKGIKGDVKIKLKRDGKGNYTWEVTGKDPQEVLKANEALRKKLGE